MDPGREGDDTGCRLTAAVFLKLCMRLGFGYHYGLRRAGIAREGVLSFAWPVLSTVVAFTLVSLLPIHVQ